MADYTCSLGFLTHMSVPRRFLPAAIMPALFRTLWKCLNLLYMEGRSHAHSAHTSPGPVHIPHYIPVGESSYKANTECYCRLPDAQILVREIELVSQPRLSCSSAHFAHHSSPYIHSAVYIYGGLFWLQSVDQCLHSVSFHMVGQSPPSGNTQPLEGKKYCLTKCSLRLMDVPRPQKERVYEIRQPALLLASLPSSDQHDGWLLWPGILFTLSPQINLLNREVHNGYPMLGHMLLPRVLCDFSCRDMNK